MWTRGHAVRLVLACAGTGWVVACGARSGLGVDLASDTSPNMPAAMHPVGTTDAQAPGVDASRPPVDAAVDHGVDAMVPIQCLATSHQTHGVPTDLFFMVDRSGSMNTVVLSPDGGPPTTRWKAVALAMGAFLNSPGSAGLGAGIGFFPLSGPGGTPDCDAGDYATPVVPMSVLPAPATAITSTILLQVLGRGTPTTPALQGAYAYAQELQGTEPNRDVAVLVVTDGEPSQCGSTIANASAAAAVGAAGSPPIRTYVLGIGPSNDNLNSIAQAGGTGHAYLVESGGAGDLTTALNQIRADSITCDYVFPPLNGAVITGTEVTVQARVGLGTPSQPLAEVRGAAACGASGGWYFDSAARPTRITLCPASCDPLMQTSGSALDILVDCH